MKPIREFLKSTHRILLDGATGTELSRRGVDLSSPSWTAAAIRRHPDILRQIHHDYVEAGAAIVTANTFRTHARNLECLGLHRDARSVTADAVQIARDAVQGRAYVAGSQAPLGDCYTPGQASESSGLIGEHRQHAENLASAGVDLVLVETQVSLGEAIVATRVALETGLPVLVSFYCRRDGSLVSGESLESAVRAITELSPQGMLLNCLPADEVAELLPIINPLQHQMLIGAYANTGRMFADGTWNDTNAVDPANYAEQAVHWMQAGARLIGGCCGTTPEHISAIAGMSCEN